MTLFYPDLIYTVVENLYAPLFIFTCVRYRVGLLLCDCSLVGLQVVDERDHDGVRFGSGRKLRCNIGSAERKHFYVMISYSLRKLTNVIILFSSPLTLTLQQYRMECLL